MAELKLVRVQLELSEEMVARMEELGRLCGLRTRKAILEESLLQLDWAVRRIQQGREIGSRSSKEDFAEFETSALFNARHAKAPE